MILSNNYIYLEKNLIFKFHIKCICIYIFECDFFNVIIFIMYFFCFLYCVYIYINIYICKNLSKILSLI